jgi:hypothetical protein
MSQLNNPHAPGWPIKGIMLDSARLTEKFEFYTDLIPRLKGWGYNTLFAHFCDDEGCSILLENTNVLPTPGAFTIKQWKKLINLAADYGITVIPEVECLGHTGYLTRLEQNKDLREPPLDGIYWSMNPVHPESLKLIDSIIHEIDQIFNAPYIHIGMDEADIGGSSATRKLLNEKPKWRIFGDYFNNVNEIIRSLGKQTLAWGDHLLSEEKLADTISKDVVICNWLYGFNYSENYKENSRYFLEKGFSIIGSPSGVWNGTLFAPNRDNIENLSGYTKAIIELSKEYGDKILGMLNTFWMPPRHLPSIMFVSAYYGGKVFNSDLDNKQWLNDFVQDEFGLYGPVSESAAMAIELLIIKRRRTKVLLALLPFDESSLKKATDKVVRSLSDYIREISVQARELLESAAVDVEKNKDEYNQWIATADMLIRVSNFSEIYHTQSAEGPFGNSRRLESTQRETQELHNNAYSGLLYIKQTYSVWEEENKKYRLHMGTRAEQLGEDTVFWEVKDSDHLLERLALTVSFVEKRKDTWI